MDATGGNGVAHANGLPSKRAAASPFYGVYLAAGLSSRFGFRIKCLQQVGRYGETLLELSVRQLLKYEVSAIIIIVSDGTYAAIHNVVGDEFLGLQVRYAYQETPAYRKKPMGTVQALLSARELLDRPFVVLNGDTLYGDSALAKVCMHIRYKDTPCMPGYPLRDVLPNTGRVNRAVIGIEGSCLTEIVEQYNIGMEDVESGRYSGDELTSMNIFGFQPEMLDYAQRKFHHWLQQNPTEDTKEYILSTMLNDLLPERGVKTYVYGVDNSVPLELTNPEDFAYVRNNLDLVDL